MLTLRVNVSTVPRSGCHVGRVAKQVIGVSLSESCFIFHDIPEILNIMKFYYKSECAVSQFESLF